MIRLEQSQTDYYLGKWLTKFVPNSSDSNWSDTERKQAQVNKTRLREEQTTNVHALFPAQIFTCHLPIGLYTSSLPVCIYKPRERASCASPAESSGAMTSPWLADRVWSRPWVTRFWTYINKFLIRLHMECLDFDYWNEAKLNRMKYKKNRSWIKQFLKGPTGNVWRQLNIFLWRNVPTWW